MIVQQQWLTTKMMALLVLGVALLAGLTVTSVIYAQTADEDLEFLVLPTSGHFHHDVYSPRMEIDTAGVDVYDPVVSAIFENPYGRRGGGFSYGFILRVNSDPDSPTVRFYVTSGREWYLFVGEERYNGYAPMDTGAYDLNGLSVELSGEYATLYLNGNQLQDAKRNKRFHLGDDTAKGDVWIVNGPFSNSVRHEAITHYDQFVVMTSEGNESERTSIAQERSLARQSTIQGNDSQDVGIGDRMPPEHQDEDMDKPKDREQ